MKLWHVAVHVPGEFCQFCPFHSNFLLPLAPCDIGARHERFLQKPKRNPVHLPKIYDIIQHIFPGLHIGFLPDGSAEACQPLDGGQLVV